MPQTIKLATDQNRSHDLETCLKNRQCNANEDHVYAINTDFLRPQKKGSALHWVNSKEAALVLLQYGGDLNKEDSDGRLPIDCAQNQEIYDLFLRWDN